MKRVIAIDRSIIATLIALLAALVLHTMPATAAEQTELAKVPELNPKVMVAPASLHGEVPQEAYYDFTSPIGFYAPRNTDSLELAHFESKPRRVDRGINRKKFIFSGEKILGISFAYMSVNSSNSDFLLMLTDVTASGSVNSIKPSVGYFYRDNRAIGARVTYTSIAAELKSSNIDLGESNGVNIEVPYINVSSTTYEYALFHRAYAALGDSGQFGLFAEVEVSAAHGKTIFGIEDTDGIYSAIESRSKRIGLGFNPGMTAFIFHNVSASVSFGLGGLQYSHIEQYNEKGIYIGDRISSKMNFSLNLMAINFGITMHLWSQKSSKY